ncbi:MAG TPA: hypothetical protein VMH83_15060 [Candidatus Acidoferrum sp.]|nr:hypothetical protein [Candidatus Acidoferrum sp.]
MPRPALHYGRRAYELDAQQAVHRWDLLSRAERVRLAGDAGYRNRIEHIAKLRWEQLALFTQYRLLVADYAAPKPIGIDVAIEAA